jgi:hypothetical protein
MNASESTAIYVDFEIDRRDLFRVNLDLAKWRLVIGLLVVAVPILGLGYLFIIIDEEQTFLQLSPLFIAAPLLAVGGQVLRLHATCRKFVSRLPESQRRFQYLFQAETDGYDLNYGESYTHVAWKDVSKAIEKPAYFVLYLNSFEARIVPKRGFHVAADIPVLRSLLYEKLGPRASLFRNANC